MRLFILSIMPLFLLLNGCITTAIRPELPTSLNGKGIVIAEPIVVGGGIDSLSYADVIINGWKKGKIGRSHFAVVLSPGEYTLDKLRKKFIYTSIFPMKLKFTIRAGEITNLGQILLVYDPEDLGQQRYTIIPVDNTEDTKYFLKTFYPQLSESLGPNSIRLGLDNYISGSGLKKLRNYITKRLIKGPPKSKRYAVGPCGIIAQIKRSNGKIIGFKPIPSPTMSGIRLAAGHHQKDRYAFITSDQRLFTIRAGKVQERPIPAVEDLDAIIITGDHDIVLCREDFKLQISNNDGHTWQAFDGTAVKTGKYGQYELVEDTNGYFIFHSSPAQLVYAAYGTSVIQNIRLPEGSYVIQRLTLNHSELFLETNNVLVGTDITPHPFFIRARSGGPWRKKLMPYGWCSPLEFLDDTGMSLQTRCDKETYQSNDGGTTWHLQ